MTKQEVSILAETLIDKHIYDYGDWHFKFDKAKRRYGQCDYNAKTISMSETLIPMMSDEDIKDTLLHEIAHAIAGAGNGHNKNWKRIAQLIGCTGERTGSKGYVKPSFVGTCPNCKVKTYKHRRTQTACAKCCRKYNNNKYTDDYKFVWKRNI